MFIINYFCRMYFMFVYLYFLLGILLGRLIAPDTEEYRDCKECFKFILIILVPVILIYLLTL